MLRGALCAILCAGLVAACGSQATGRGSSDASLVLDFTPNAIHAGIYTAIARGYTRRNHLHLHVIVPGASTDAISLLLSGRTQFAILDIHDLALAAAQGKPLVGVMALVERPLAAVIASPGIGSPRDLAGRTVGVTGAPSDLAVLRSEVAGAGGQPDRVRTVTIGYNAVPDLLSGRVAAATAFWNDEGLTIQAKRPGFHVFRVDQYGAPPYPELVLCTTRAIIRDDPRLVSDLVDSLVEGYQAVLRDPRAGAAALESRVQGLSPQLVSRQLHAELPAFRPAGGGSVGALVPSTLRAWARWEARFGIVNRVPDVSRMFTQRFLPGR
ncbi:MAG TPA: ABC transporter substrate-binding protein [Solirubrobacteraceae bacterium]|nr:ABC transporter substrate-binding protein [Solirubrobacteraceae bacterium]